MLDKLDWQDRESALSGSLQRNVVNVIAVKFNYLVIFIYSYIYLIILTWNVLHKK